MSDLFGRSQGGGKVIPPIQQITVIPIGNTATFPYTAPAGKLAMIADVSVAYAGTITGVAFNVGIQHGATNYFFSQQPTVVANQIYSPPLPSPCYLEPGDSLVVQITGATVAGANLTVNVYVYEFTPDSAFHP